MDSLSYFSASGGFIPDNCAPSVDPIPWISEKWTPDLGKRLNCHHFHFDCDHFA